MLGDRDAILKDLLHGRLARDAVEPPVTPRVQVLPFNALSWENFERLCTACGTRPARMRAACW